jgi:hypothetical protein
VWLQVAKFVQVTKLFSERLQAYKHAVAYLEDYVGATEKTNHAHGKEYERVLKVGHIAKSKWTCANSVQTVKDPLKQGHHFDQSLGGIAGMFENIRSNTQVRYTIFRLYLSANPWPRASPTSTTKQQSNSRALFCPSSSVYTLRSRTRARS